MLGCPLSSLKPSQLSEGNFNLHQRILPLEGLAARELYVGYMAILIAYR